MDSSSDPFTVEELILTIVMKTFIVQNHIPHLVQGSHRLEKNLNLEGFVEKFLKIKSALKSTGKITQKP